MRYFPFLLLYISTSHSVCTGPQPIQLPVVSPTSPSALPNTGHRHCNNSWRFSAASAPVSHAIFFKWLHTCTSEPVYCPCKAVLFVRYTSGEIINICDLL